MRLSYGVFIRLLTLCKNPEETNIGIVKALVAAVDSKRQYPELTHEYVGDMIKCQSNLRKPHADDAEHPSGFWDIVTVAREISVDDLAENFAKSIVPKINEDKRGNLVLAIMRIIERDSEVETKNPKAFEKYAGKPKSEFLEQRKINLPSFLAGLFLYALLEVENKTGKGCTEKECSVAKASGEAARHSDKNHEIKPEYAKKIREAIEACGKDCVLSINDMYVAHFDEDKDSIEFVGNSVAKKSDENSSQTIYNVTQHGEKSVFIQEITGTTNFNF